jgi:hypothetical protein
VKKASNIIDAEISNLNIDQNFVPLDISVIRETVGVAKHLQNLSDVNLSDLFAHVSHFDLDSVLGKVSTVVEPRVSDRGNLTYVRSLQI